MHKSDLAQSTFLDIAANLLAIVLVITLFSLVTVKHQNTSATEPVVKTDSELLFIAPRRDLFPPFSVFFFVLADRIVRWDQDAVIDALHVDPQSFSGKTRQGNYQWLPEPLIARDIDTFQLDFLPDLQAILAHEPLLSDEKIDQSVTDMIEMYQNNRMAPVFIVYPGGMAIFVKLYARLQDAGVRFRWFAHHADEPLFLGRHPAQFTDYAIYW